MFRKIEGDQNFTEGNQTDRSSYYSYEINKLKSIAVLCQSTEIKIQEDIRVCVLIEEGLCTVDDYR
jgi:hypothetical protein